MSESSKLILAGLIAFLVILIITKPAYSGIGTFTFRKVADTTTPIPGGTGSFTGFGNISISGDNVAFVGIGTSDQRGIYTDIGGLGVVADRSTPIPGGTGSFTTFFTPPSISGDNVAFRGRGNSSSFQEGIYISTGGSLVVVADRSTPVPGGTGSFILFGKPSISGDNVAFLGGGTFGQRGIYISTGGSLVVVADTSTMIPGGTGSFTGFGNPSISGDNVAFEGSGNSSSIQRGIYISTGGSLVVVADRSTPIPGGTGSFTGFSEPSLDGGNVAFLGFGFDQRGIYTDIGGLGVVADTSTMIPDGTGTFEVFEGPSLSGDNVAFVGITILGIIDDFLETDDGIYTDIGGSLIKFIHEGDSFDGKTLSSFSFDREGLSGNSIAFAAGVGSAGIIFVAELVSPPPDVSQACDANGSGSITAADVTALINHLRNRAPAAGNADCNNSGTVTAADVTALINVLRGRTQPPM